MPCGPSLSLAPPPSIYLRTISLAPHPCPTCQSCAHAHAALLHPPSSSYPLLLQRRRSRSMHSRCCAAPSTSAAATAVACLCPRLQRARTRSATQSRSPASTWASPTASSRCAFTASIVAQRLGISVFSAKVLGMRVQCLVLQCNACACNWICFSFSFSSSSWVEQCNPRGCLPD